MAKYFNVNGACYQGEHYMVPINLIQIFKYLFINSQMSVKPVN